VTSLPNTQDAKEDYNLQRRMVVELIDRAADSPIKSSSDLVNKILTICVDFFNREGPCNVKFQECFRSTISDIVSLSLCLDQLSG